MTAKGLPLHRNKIQDKHFREQNLSLNIKIIFRVRCMKCNVYVYYNVCNVYMLGEERVVGIMWAYNLLQEKIIIMT